MSTATNRLGLALSGGGFRASLYHLGLVRFLRDAGILPLVTHITSVSGGSVLAAHLVLNWDRYNASPKEFDAAAAEVLAYVRLDVRNRIIRRFPLALPLRGPRRLLGRSNRKLSRTGLLEYHYEKYLYGDTSLFQLPERPQLHLLATSVSEGCLCSFNRNGMLAVRRQPGKAIRLDRTRMGLATVAMAVAASSAFPGFFPPLELTGTDVGAIGGEFDRQAYTDGAVFDNLGVRMFRCLERPLLADSGLTRDDFLDFPEVFEVLRQASVSAEQTPLRRLTQLLMPGGRRLDLRRLTNGAEAGAEAPEPAAGTGSARGQPYPPPAPDAGAGDVEERLLARLSHILRHYQLDRDPLFGALTPADPDAAASLRTGQLGGRTLTADDQLWLNRHLLDAAFRQATGHACFRRLNGRLDGVLVSDVGKPFEVQAAGHAGGLIRTAMRASDILMDRVWQLEIETFAGTPGFVFAPVTEVVEPAEDPTALHPEVQRQVAGIRTDFDRFSDLEVSSLVRHGYCVARKACRARPDLFGADLPADPPWDPIPQARGAAPPAAVAARPGGPPRESAPATVEARALQGSAARRIWTTLLDRRDWVSYVYVPLIVPILVLLPYVAVKYYKRYHHQSVLVHSLAQGSRDVEVMDRLLEQGPEPRWAGVAAEEVSKLDEPDPKGFVVLQDSWIMDLRRWKPTGPARNDPDSYAFHSRRLKVAKTPDNTANSVFRWGLLPRDPKAEFRFPHQELRATLRKSLDMDTSASGRTCRWQAEFDFRNVPAGQFVNLVVEHLGAGWYLEDDSGGTTVPLNIRADTAELTVWILMPKGREYSNYRVIRHKEGDKNVEAVNVVTEYLAEDLTILAFKLLSLKAGYTYEVSWTYK
jgi:predicted acylesterase/phospholipase RssA